MLRTKDPTTFRALQINDPHWSATPTSPALKTDQLKLLEDNLERLTTKGKEIGIDTVLWGGDMFHRKDPRANPLGLVTRTIRQLKRMGEELDALHYGIAGNHDLRYGSLETSLAGSPLETLTAAGCFTLLDNLEPIFTDAHGHTIRIAGGSYEHGQAEHVRDKKRQGADTLITLGHFWLGTQTGEFYGEHLYGHDFFRDCETDTLCVGHHHADNGIHKTHGKLFASQGSITLLGSHADDLTRKPAAVLIEVSAGETKITVLRPKMPPIWEIIDTERHQQLREEGQEVDEFIASLASAEIAALQPEEILDELNPPAEVKRKTLDYLERAEK